MVDKIIKAFWFSFWHTLSSSSSSTTSVHPKALSFPAWSVRLWIFRGNAQVPPSCLLSVCVCVCFFYVWETHLKDSSGKHYRQAVFNGCPSTWHASLFIIWPQLISLTLNSAINPSSNILGLPRQFLFCATSCTLGFHSFHFSLNNAFPFFSLIKLDNYYTISKF